MKIKKNYKIKSLIYYNNQNNINNYINNIYKAKINKKTQN